jgi:hypothetical protein
MKKAFAELFYIDRATVNLAKPTLGMAIVLVALILLSTIGPFGFTMAFGAVLAVAFDGGGPPHRRVAGLVIFARAARWLRCWATAPGTANGAASP